MKLYMVTKELICEDLKGFTDNISPGGVIRYVFFNHSFRITFF